MSITKKLKWIKSYTSNTIGSNMNVRHPEKWNVYFTTINEYNIIIFTENPTFNYPYCKGIITKGEIEKND